MGLRSTTLGVLILALPIAVEIPSEPDSVRGRGGETRITVIGSMGRYAIIDRGCENQVIDTHPAEFREAAAAIEHRFSNGMTFGLRGGTVRDELETDVIDYSTYPNRESVVVVNTDIPYLNPSLGVEFGNLSLGVGLFSRQNRRKHARMRYSFHARFGSMQSTHFKVSYLEGVPLYASGATEIGLGLHPHRRWDVSVV